MQRKPSRRGVLKAAGAISLVGAGGLPVVAQAAGQQVAGFRPESSPSAETLWSWLKKLHDFGPMRAAGTAKATAFEQFLMTEFEKLGCTIERDPYKLTSWECEITNCSISVKEDGGATKTLDVVAYYPFCGSTKGKAAISGKVIFGGTGDGCGPEILAKYSEAQLAESIVVVDMPLGKYGIRGPIEYYPETFPSQLPPLPTYPPIKGQGGKGPMGALENKCRGIIFCYSDCSEEAARHNYLPFSDPHRKIPGLWVGRADTAYLKSVAGKATATMRCDATLTPNSKTESFLATLKGQTDEVILLTTHTDGPNEVNDNGALGVLAVATYWSKIPLAQRPRTMVFSLPTGHYAAGAIADPVTGSGRRAGTRGLLAKHPDVVKRAVAHIAMEQMGAMDWQDINFKWQPTGMPAPQNWIPTKPIQRADKTHDTGVAESARKMFVAASAAENPKFSRAALLSGGGFGPGEGGSLREMGIPGIGLMGQPQYFFRADPKGVLDKLSPQVMKNEVDIITKMTVLMQRLSTTQLAGHADITPRDLYAQAGSGPA